MKIVIFLFSLLINCDAIGQVAAKIQMRYMMQQTPTPNEIPYGANINTGHYVQVQDTKIYYEVYGKGSPLLMLHGGLFGSTYEMAQLIDSFSKDHTVIAVSTRGHGKSGLGRQQLTLDLLANDIYAVIQDALKPADSVTIFGFSYGGYAGYKLASTHPERVKRLIVMGAAERHPGDMDLLVTPEDGIKLDSAYWKQQMALMPEPSRMPELFSTIEEFFNKRMVADKALFETIKCPVLVMGGYHDGFIKPQQYLNAASTLPKGELAILPNSTHGAFLEHFDAVWASIHAFLK